LIEKEALAKGDENAIRTRTELRDEPTGRTELLGDLDRWLPFVGRLPDGLTA
jgi:hypothetical protein